MATLLQDLRYALRTLARSPGFTAAAVLTLGLGIGAATAGFTLLDWLLLRPVAGVREPSRAGFVWLAVHENGGYSPNSLTREQLNIVLGHAPAVTGLAGREGPLDVNAAAGHGDPQRVSVEFVASNYFQVLGVPITLGRAFVPEDNAEPGGRRVAVISDRLWHEMYGGRPDVLGATIRINGLSCTVIGVVAPGFRGPDHLRESDAWLPGATYFGIQHFSYRGPAASRELPYDRFVLRLRPTATFDEAASQLQSAVHALALADTTQLSPNLEANVIPRLGLEAMYGSRGIIDHQLTLALGIAGLVLLVACANVANLLLLRRTQRRADTVVRLALGASRARLVRYGLTEDVLVGLASGATGVGLALLLLELFRRFRMRGFISLEHITLDHRVLGFAVAAGVLASVLAGVIPAVLGSRADLSSDLRASGPTLAGGAPLLRSGLAILQVAVSLSLVAGSYLFARTLQRYAAVPLGFDPSGVTVFAADPNAQGYTPEQARAYVRALQLRISALPGVQPVALLALPPFQGVTDNQAIRRDDAPPGTKPLSVASNQVSGDYFSVLGIPLLQGASFQSADLWPDSTRAFGKAILSARLAQQLYASDNPVGRIVSLPDYRGDHHAEVVGVVGDVHWIDRGGDIEPMLYTPVSQHGFRPPMIAVRSASPRERWSRRSSRSVGGLIPRCRSRPSDRCATTSRPRRRARHSSSSWWVCSRALRSCSRPSACIRSSPTA